MAFSMQIAAVCLPVSAEFLFVNNIIGVLGCHEFFTLIICEQYFNLIMSWLPANQILPDIWFMDWLI